MVKSNNRKKYSSAIHNSNRYRANLSSPAIKKTILLVIMIASLVVAFSIIYTIFFNTEKVIKSKISALATDYYENYFYENLINSDKFKQIKNLDTEMEKYHTDGLAPVSLSNLLLYDNQKNDEYRDYLTTYCDENATTIKFYMDPPYERTSYHYDINYSCNF